MRAFFFVFLFFPSSSHIFRIHSDLCSLVKSEGSGNINLSNNIEAAAVIVFGVFSIHTHILAAGWKRCAIIENNNQQQPNKQ